MRSRYILLVEDNPLDEDLTLRALKKHHIRNTVVVARDGAEALDFLFARGAHAGRRREDLPDIVLLDLNLPKLSGLEVIKAIRADADTRLLPVVILTSSRQDSDVAEGYGNGANSYVVKPIDFNQFSEAVRQLGLYWLAINESPLPG